MLSLHELKGGEIIPKDSSTLPDEIKHLIEAFSQRVARLYLSKQEGRVGIKSLGNVIRHDEIINSLLESSNHLIVRSTRNRSEIIKLHLDSLAKAQETNVGEIYYLMFSKELVYSSNIVDRSSMNLENWSDSLSSLLNYYNQKNEVKLFFIVVEQIDGYSFHKHNLKYTKIIQQSYE